MTDKELQEAASGFLDMAFNLGEPAAAVSEHLGGMFVQHNPQVEDGAEAFIGFVNSMRSQFPGMHLEIKRVWGIHLTGATQISDAPGAARETGSLTP